MAESRVNKISIPSQVSEAFDSAYATNISNEDIDTCTGQGVGYEKRAIVLFPFEEKYLVDLLGADNKIGSGVAAHMDCPYKTVEGKCSIGKNKPLHCRMSPFEIKPVAARELEFFIKKIPLDSSFVDSAIQYWSGVFISLWSYLSASWWRYHKETLHGFNFTSLGIIKFDLPEDSHPLEPTGGGDIMTYDEMSKFIDPNCKLCGGIEGMIPDQESGSGHLVPCNCVRKNYWER